MGLFLLAPAGAAGTIAGAAAAIGTANALFSAFLGFPYKPGSKAQNQDDNGNDQIINRIHIPHALSNTKTSAFPFFLPRTHKTPMTSPNSRTKQPPPMAAGMLRAVGAVSSVPMV